MPANENNKAKRIDIDFYYVLSFELQGVKAAVEGVLKE